MVQIAVIINYYNKSRRYGRRTEHDVILGVSVHVGLVEISREDFNVSASAVDLLLVFDGELDHQRFALVAEGLEAGRGGVETGILTALQACW